MRFEEQTEALKNLPPAKRQMLLKLLEREAARKGGPLPIPRRREGGPAPLSFAQQRLWFLDRLSPGSAAYNLAFAVLLEGRLDAAALAGSLREVARRHEVLRARFSAVAGQPVQETAAAPYEPRLPCVDLGGLAGTAAGHAEALRLIDDHGARPFDLERGPLLRTLLVRQGERRHALLFAVHHIAFDGASLPNLLREMAALYPAVAAGLPSPLPEPPLQYAEFAVWQRGRLAGERLERHLAYWRERLSGAPPVLDLPADRPRPAVRSAAGGRRDLELDAELSGAVEALGRRSGATLFMTLLAAYQALLGRYSNQPVILVGSPVAHRNRPELEGLLGFFVDTVVLRGDLGGNPSFRELVRRTAESAAGAFEHQELPFEKLVDELGLARSLSHNPLAQVTFALQSTVEPLAMEIGAGLRLSPLPVGNCTAKFDLGLSFAATPEGLAGGFEYSRDLFDAPMVERLGRAFTRLLGAAAARPETPVWDLPLLSASERRQLCEWGGARDARASAPRCLHEIFAEQAGLSPEAVAVVCGEEALSYGELLRQAEALGRRLAGRGVIPGERVGLAAERGLGLVAGILGILSAGAAYVPLDPAQPRERLAFQLRDAGVRWLLAGEGIDGFPRVGRVPLAPTGEVPAAGAPALVRPPATAPAYVIYTSGSTGQPKGVEVSHANVQRLFTATADWFGFGPEDVWTLFHSYTFDFSVWELWGPLLHGGRLVVVPHAVSRSPRDFHALLARERVTVLNQTPSAFRPLIEADRVAAGLSALALRAVIFGGEALDPRSLGPWLARHSAERPRLVNMYGITETTVHVTYRPLSRREAEAASGSGIGIPIPDLAVHVLDRRGRLAPIGVPGEIHVGGEGVAAGYLRRPALTAERFVPDPFGRPGGRLYRSGDLARWRPAGDLEYLGRIDQQVKIRGFRIELGEIESALASHPAVAAAAVLARPLPGAPESRLVAYFVAAEPGRAPRPEELRRHLGERLPDYMVPAVFVALPALPTTGNGKLDRAALPEESAERPDLDVGYAAPRTPVERELCAVWAEVLGLGQVGIHDNFFSLGGDSILSLRAVALSGERGVGIALPDLFRHQTVAELAGLVSPSPEGAETAAGRAPFSLLAAEDRARLPEGLEDAYPLASLQAGMLYHLELSPGDPLYHNVVSWHLRGPFAADPFARAVAAVVARHPALRTAFDLTSYGEPLQLVHRAAELPIVVEDLQGLGEAEQEAQVAALVAHEKETFFDLAQPPQIRLHVFRRAHDRFQLTLTENHAILDGWSLHSALAEIARAYFALLDGEPLPAEPPLPLAYRDFVRREREALRSPSTEAFWRDLLADCTLFELPRWPAVRLAAEPALSRGVALLPLPAQLVADLERLAREAAVPLKSVLLAAHLTVLGSLAGRDDVLTGVVSNGRLEEPGGDRVLGLFLNTLPLRLRLGAESWRERARRTFALEREILEHRRYPMAALQSRWGERRLLTVAFNYLNFHVVQSLLQSGRMAVLGDLGAERTDFQLVAHFIRRPENGEMRLQLEFDPAAVPAAQAAAFRDAFSRVLARMAADPDGSPAGLSLLTAVERQQLLREWNDSAERYRGPATILGWIAGQVKRHPEQVAVAGEEEELRYRELGERSHRLARRLRRLGVAAEVPVAICAERSPALIVGLLAILEAGGAYVPLDPSYPRERLAGVLDDALGGASPALLLTQRGLWDGASELWGEGSGPAGLEVVFLDSQEEEEAEWAEPLPENLAYVIYTSGSTGRPKGAMNQHGAILNRLIWMQSLLDLAPGEGVLQKTPVGFDVSVWELFLPLMVGARLVLARPEGHKDPAYLIERIEQAAVTTAHFVPSMLAAFLDEPEVARCRSLKRVVASGEALSGELARRFAARLPWAALVNLYGPTEAAVDVTCHVCGAEAGAAVPLGRPIANVFIHLLDREGEPVPPGVAGEISIGGVAVGRGYLDRPDLTAERFVPHPAGAGERLYRTGDLGRRGSSGEIEYLGRLDHQVKVRGVRIELGEIEAVLARHPGVREAVVLARQGDREASGEVRLAAYVVPAPAAPERDELRAFLRARLPEAMVPPDLLVLDRLPLLPNGKVDRKALPAPERDAAARRSAPPAGRNEEALAALWAEVLGIESVGRDDSFFDLGGHSLLLMQVRKKMQERFGRAFSMLELFRYPTVRAMAEHLEAGAADAAPQADRTDRETELRQGRDRLRQLRSRR